MRKILASTVAAVVVFAAISSAQAEQGKFVFRWKGVVLTADARPGTPSTGEPGNGGEGSGGTGDTETDNGGEGSGDGSGGGGGSGNGGDDEGGTAARMTLSARPDDDQAKRDHYAQNMPFGIPAFLASPSGTYGDGDVISLCWDTQVNDAAGIGGSFTQQIQLPPSPLVRAISVGGHRVERDMESFDMVIIDRPGSNGCADLELTVPAADSFGWGMGIPFGVVVKVDVFNGWWARSPEGWEAPDAYETGPYEGPGWFYLDAQRVG